MMWCKKILVMVLGAITVMAAAQEIPQEAPKEKRPFIEMFRPIYLATGIPVTEKPTAENADVKFQVSLAIPLWRDMLGSGIDLLVAYTQLSLWNLYGYSSPFYDNTYIPGLYARKSWKDADGVPMRTLLWGIEHRSNGRNDAWSRSVNYVLLSYGRDYPFGLSLQAAARLGYGWYGDAVTFDVPLKYFGLFQLSATYATPGKGWEFMTSVTPVWNKSIANVNVEIARRIGKKHNNPYFFIQFHYGYDEALRDCINVNGPLVNEDGTVPYKAAAPLPPRAIVRAGVILTPHTMMRGNL